MSDPLLPPPRIKAAIPEKTPLPESSVPFDSNEPALPEVLHSRRADGTPLPEVNWPPKGLFDERPKEPKVTLGGILGLLAIAGFLFIGFNFFSSLSAPNTTTEAAPLVSDFAPAGSDEEQVIPPNPVPAAEPVQPYTPEETPVTPVAPVIEPAPAPEPVPVPVQPAPIAPTPINYGSCAAAERAGVSIPSQGYKQGQDIEYDYYGHRDTDGDGYICEE